MRFGLGIPGGRRSAGASGPALNVPAFVVQEGGVDTHAETELADLSARATVDDGDGFTTTNVELYESGVLVGSMANGGGGLWTLAQNDRAPGTYSYRGKRITASGSKFSAAWEVVISAVAPTLTEPDGGEAITTGAVFELTATTFSDANTTGVTFHVTGPSAYDQTFTGVLDTGVWEYSWDTTGLADGSYTVTAIRAGSWGTVSSTPASVDVAAVEFSPLIGAQSSTVLINAAAFAPIVGVQSSSATIVAEEGGAFSPLDISGCVLWVDMLDPGSFAQSGGLITSITNKVSSVSMTSASLHLSYNATGLNGHPCAEGNGTSQRIIGTEAAVVAALTDAHAYTLFYMAIFDTVDRNDAMFGVGNTGQATNRVRYWGQSSSSTGRWVTSHVNDAAGTVTTVGTGQSVNTANVHCWYSPGTTVSLKLNDGAANPAAAAHNPGTLTPNQFALFVQPRQTPNNYADGKCGEWLLYDRELTGAEQTQIVNYLNARWA